MRILWLTWKDIEHPKAGGAEVVNEELAARLAHDGHAVTFVVGGFAGGAPTVSRRGFTVLRTGNRFSVYVSAYFMYRRHHRGKFDVVIDEMNTIPFFAALYAKERVIMFVHQLARQIWFYEMSFPVSTIGYLLEPLYLRLLSTCKVITISNSTKQDLIRYGFVPHNISVISQGISIQPVESIANVQKLPEPTLLAFGSIRAMKRTDHIVRAFEIAKQSVPNLQLVVAGKPDGEYGNRVMNLIKKSRYRDSIKTIPSVTPEERLNLMQQAHVLAVTSVKEGWGLVVTEANSQGTPAVVYNVDGLRDSVQHNQTGLIAAQNSPESLAASIVTLLQDPNLYQRLQKSAHDWSKTINFDTAYRDFKKVLQEK